MLYLDHDFYSNFNSGVESGDNDMISNLLVNEISELIVYKEEKLFDLLEKVQIKLNDKASDEKIVDTILNNIPSNVKLCKGLAYLIAENNSPKSKAKEIEGKDGKKKKVRKNKTATYSEIDAIATGIVGIGDSFEHKPQLKKEFKLKLMQVIKTKSKAVGDRERKHTNNTNGKYLLLALLVIGAGIGVYFIIKNRKKVAAEGLELEGTPPEVKTPDVVIPPPPIEPLTPPIVAAPVEVPIKIVDPIMVSEN